MNFFDMDRIFGINNTIFRNFCDICYNRIFGTKIPFLETVNFSDDFVLAKVNCTGIKVGLHVIYIEIDINKITMECYIL